MLGNRAKKKDVKWIGTSVNDTYFAGDGNDSLWGHLGNDFLDGGKGNDLIYGGAGNDTIHGGSGNDSLYGEAGNDLFFEGSGKNFLWGNDGNDRFILTGGQNVASGGWGIDRFSIGGKQNTTLAGGSGRDLYIFGQVIDGNGFGSALPEGTITIQDDFTTKNWGVIDLTSLNLELMSNRPDTSKNDLYIRRLGDNLVLDVIYESKKRLSVVLEGATSLNQKDFLLY